MLNTDGIEEGEQLEQKSPELPCFCVYFEHDMELQIDQLNV